ncbi:MAG: hypothetical protein IMF19_02615 [Proteobacteria bacterium]|nr:hypothetical protein [Pseudomonadota bacterium]
MKLGRAIPTPIRIMPTDSHGFIVDVGFATFACETSESAVHVLEAYLLQPTAFIKDIEDVRNRGKDGSKNPTQSSILMPGPILEPLKGSKSSSPKF